MIRDVAAKSPDLSIERKGPKVGAPEKALAGFLRGAGLESLDQCDIQSNKKGEFYVARIEKPGRPAAELLAEAVTHAVLTLSWPKSMRWGSGKLRWVRPLHSILCLLDGKVVKLKIEGLASSNRTFGHRFMAPEALTIGSFEEYETKLAKAFVLTSAPARRKAILQEAQKQAKKAGLELVEDAALLAETAGLVEWPVVLMGRFDESFLDVPQEVLITSMKKHQKCFSLKEPETGELANRFLTVANLAAKDGGKAIINGNERVIRARLSDAVFFWEQDLKTPLEKMAKQLDDIIFHEKLGSQGERVERIATLAGLLASHTGANEEQARRAAHLCKADLVSEMVGEFASLQGLMGRYYAEKQGENSAVAFACEEHYRPQGPGDAVPAEPVSITVALADKLDILAGFWAIGEKPTGSKDPFALRRAALGIIRLLLENNIRLTLHKWFETAIIKHRGEEPGALASDLLSFFADRLKVYLRDKGARHDLIDAVFSLEGQDDLVMIVRRVEALGTFLDTDDGNRLLAGIRRAANILRIEEKKDAKPVQTLPHKGLLQQKEERDLFKAIETMEEVGSKALEREDFAAAMTALAALKAPVDAFFDKVTVNDANEELRANRLALLAQIRSATMKIADFSKIEG